DLLGLVGVAVARERDAVGAEGVGLEHVGAGVGVLLVQLLDELGLRQVELVERPGEEDAALVEQRADRAVEEQRRGAQSVEERPHVMPLPRQGSLRTTRSRKSPITAEAAWNLKPVSSNRGMRSGR